VEIITGVERRRRWRLDEKVRIVAEAEAPGACFAEVARRHDVSRGLLWMWRRQVRDGELGQGGATFLPMQVVPDVGTPMPPATAAPVTPRRQTSAAAATIEIALPDGTTIRVGGDVSAAALRRVLGAVRG
jgi:transposase